MGIAAYNRGTALVSRLIDAEFGDRVTANNLEVIERLNGYPKGTSRLFQPTVIRRDPTKLGGWWIMDVENEGWSSFGYWYKDIKALMSHWDVTIFGIGKDQHSMFFRCK